MNDFHGKVSPSYLHQAANVFSHIKQLSYTRMRILPGDHVLDVGCGSGLDVIAITEQLDATGKVTGLDYDTTMLKQALPKIEEAPRGRQASFVQGISGELPFGNDAFDSCRSERLFVHLLRPEQTLAEMIRVTKPGGKVVVVDTDWSSLSIDTPFPSIERALSEYLLTCVSKNGYSGRSLYRQFRQLRLADIHIEVHPLFVTDKDLFYSLTMLEAIEEQALAEQRISAEQLENWRREIRRASETDCFYGSVNVVMVSAVKTESS